MPFVEVDIDAEIEKRRNADPEFKKAWDNSRMEYEILGQLIKLRNQKGWTQQELAEKAETSQQRISRIEKHEQSPTLKTLCRMADALNVNITLTPR